MDKESSSEGLNQYIKRYLDAIEYARLQKGEDYVANQKIAEAVGLTDHSTVSNWAWRGMPRKHIPKFAAYLGIREEWLAFNKGQMIEEELPADAQEALNIFLSFDVEERAAWLKLLKRSV